LCLAVKAVSNAGRDTIHAVYGFCAMLLLLLLQDDEEDSKYAYNSDDEGEPDYGMANEMDI
jgi:hypothetical protein